MRRKSQTEYIEFLEEYIEKKHVCDYILANIKSNHVLNKRFDILEYAIGCYLEKKFTTFINIAIIQIEGIFYDYCYQMDIQPDRIDKFSINSKLDLLNNKQVFNAYDYFAFDFPLIRNKVAHGLLTDLINDLEIKKVAYETLLDLQYLVYDFNTNKLFPYYEPLNLVNMYINAENYTKDNKSNPKDECLYSHLTRNKYRLIPCDPINNLHWILNPMYDEVYKFYELLDEHIEIRKHLLSFNFIEFIDKKLNQVIEEMMLSTYYKVYMDELISWATNLQVIICYCNENKVDENLLNNVKKLKHTIDSFLKQKE